MTPEAPKATATFEENRHLFSKAVKPTQCLRCGIRFAHPLADQPCAKASPSTPTAKELAERMRAGKTGVMNVHYRLSCELGDAVVAALEKSDSPALKEQLRWAVGALMVAKNIDNIIAKDDLIDAALLKLRQTGLLESAAAEKQETDTR